MTVGGCGKDVLIAESMAVVILANFVDVACQFDMLMLMLLNQIEDGKVHLCYPKRAVHFPQL